MSPAGLALKCVLSAATVGLAYALKDAYAGADADSLRPILEPTAWWVECLSGVPFEWEERAGFIDQRRQFVIAPSCAGVNFMVASLVMLAGVALARARRARPCMALWVLAVLSSVPFAVFVNGGRITLLLWLQRAGATVFGLDPAQLHRQLGVAVYLGALCVLYAALTSRGGVREPCPGTRPPAFFGRAGG